MPLKKLRLFAFALLICVKSVYSYADEREAVFDEATGVLSIPTLRFDNEFYDVRLTLMDPAQLLFKAELSSARFLSTNTGAYFDASFSTSTGRLVLSRLRLGGQYYFVVLTLTDSAQLLFKVDPASVRVVGSVTSAPGAVANAFSHIADESAGLPVVDNYFTVTFPADTQSGQPESVNKVALPYAQLSVTPLAGTRSLAMFSATLSSVAFTASPVNCTLKFEIVVDLANPNGVLVTLRPDVALFTETYGNYGILTCSKSVTDTRGRSWSLGMSGRVGGDFSVTASAQPAGSTTGSVLFSLSGTGTAPGLLQTASVFRGGTVALSVKVKADMEKRADGSVYSGGTLVKAASGGGGSGGGGSGSCGVAYSVNSLMGYYSSGNFASAVSAAGRGSVASMDGGKIVTLFSDVLAEGVPRFRLQLMIPAAYWKVGSMNVRDDQNIPGFDSVSGRGAIARMIYSIGKSNAVEVNDSFWSNKDFGSQKARAGESIGTITISSLSATRVTGTFSAMQLTGDGYPSLNNFAANMSSGSFCIDL